MSRKIETKSNANKGKSKSTHHQGKPNSKGRYKDSVSASLDATDRDNNPNWYFEDARIAEQVSQISFRQVAGYPITMNGVNFPVPNIFLIYLNASPGVTRLSAYRKEAGINMAGFRLFTQLSAYTGRTATYGPQDISTMILAMEAMIEKVEWTRRAFGLAYQMNMRNRAYPQAILAALGIDPDDFFANYAEYRNRFNRVVTVLNQIPIPLNIAIFDKAASLYEKVYLDMPSSMAQTILTNLATTWEIDETGYSGGTVLRTTDWTVNHTTGATIGVQLFSVYLSSLENSAINMLNASSLQVVYTDLLNLANKIGIPFWKFDYLSDGYTVVPEFNLNFSLQMHNMISTGVPNYITSETDLSKGWTPYNDVYPDAGSNRLMYHPVFNTLNDTSMGVGAMPQAAILDMPTDSPTVEDRIEATRYMCLEGGTRDTATGGTNGAAIDGITLPDHYPVKFSYLRTGMSTPLEVSGSVLPNTGSTDRLAANSAIDWAPHLYQSNPAYTSLTQVHAGELNFYTVYDWGIADQVNDFVTLALYSLRG